jgi:(S)-ureidoglycine aminohydrolase
MTRDRGRRGAAFTLITPGNRFMSRLPTLPGAGVYKLVTPRMPGAVFGQYLLELPAGGTRMELETGYEHFLFGLGDGDVSAGSAGVAVLDAEFALGDGGFAYVPAGGGATLTAPDAARMLWLKRPYQQWPGLASPCAAGGHVAAVEETATAVPGLTRQELIDPTDAAYDFNMSLMRFAPGIGLPQIEIHDEEHGLYMTAGGGEYQLDGEEHPVRAGDFIYMAPYCPQGFVAGPDGAAYLLYKDVHRDGFWAGPDPGSGSTAG